ncbi:MAG: AraC family transcriptional regulator [Beijerinckiaceae bacterium]|nr:AraC family transcriptional regulator [Beijerinckiaceae bacterium]
MSDPKFEPKFDPIADLLRSVRLSGAVFLEADFTEPWSVSSKLTKEECERLGAQHGRVIAYHYVASGAALVKVGGDTALSIGPGEIVLLPRNDDHVLASDLALRPALADPHITVSDEGMCKLTYGGGGAPTAIYCGYLAHDESLLPLLSLLPQAMKLKVDEVDGARWIETTFRYAARQQKDPARQQPAMIARLAELLLVEGLRQHMAQHASQGFLDGLRDDAISRALALLHDNIGRSWTTEELAEKVAMSRSAFADRFTRLVGAPPMRYLGQRRLEEASRRLQQTRGTVASIAFAVGYDSEAAFTRSFKKAFGLPPVAWRRRQTGEKAEPTKAV